MKIVLGNNLSESFRAYFNAKAARGEVELMAADIGLFPSQEPFSELKADPAGQDIVVFQPLSGAVSQHCLHLLLTVATLKRYGARHVTVAMPFAAFGRQDKGTEGRFPSLAADDFAKLLKAAGADKIATAEMHSKRAEQYFKNHFGKENAIFISTAGLFARHVRQHANPDRIVVGAPDGGDKPKDAAQTRARDIAARLGDAPMFKIWKTHQGISQTKIEKFEGDVAGRQAVLADDMSDSGGTILNGCRIVKENGAVQTHAYLTHALFNEQAFKNLLGRKIGDEWVVDSLGITDTVPGAEKLCALPAARGRVEILPTAPLFASALKL